MPARLILAPLLTLLLSLWAAPALSQPQTESTVVVLSPAALLDGQGRPAGRAEAFSAWTMLGRDGGRLALRDAQGGHFILEPGQEAVLPGPPSFHAERLARLRAAPLEGGTARRLAAGVIQAGDSQWLVEMAWGRPWRSFMVNRFQDEEHYVYRSDAPEPILLRFKGGRLTPPLPPQLETPGPPR